MSDKPGRKITSLATLIISTLLTSVLLVSCGSSEIEIMENSYVNVVMKIPFERSCYPVFTTDEGEVVYVNSEDNSTTLTFFSPKDSPQDKVYKLDGFDSYPIEIYRVDDELQYYGLKLSEEDDYSIVSARFKKDTKDAVSLKSVCSGVDEYFGQKLSQQFYGNFSRPGMADDDYLETRTLIVEKSPDKSKMLFYSITYDSESLFMSGVIIDNNNRILDSVKKQFRLDGSRTSLSNPLIDNHANLFIALSEKTDTASQVTLYRYHMGEVEPVRAKFPEKIKGKEYTFDDYSLITFTNDGSIMYCGNAVDIRNHVIGESWDNLAIITAGFDIKDNKATYACLNTIDEKFLNAIGSEEFKYFHLTALYADGKAANYAALESFRVGLFNPNLLAETGDVVLAEFNHDGRLRQAEKIIDKTYREVWLSGYPVMTHFPYYPIWSSRFRLTDKTLTTVFLSRGDRLGLFWDVYNIEKHSAMDSQQIFAVSGVSWVYPGLTRWLDDGYILSIGREEMMPPLLQAIILKKR